MLTKSKQIPKLLRVSAMRHFAGGGAYNPHNYKDHSTPKEYPNNEDVVNYLESIYSLPNFPRRNMRHVNPVRQSGPIPPYDGPHTMENIRKTFHNACISNSRHPCSVDIDELMRRVPGIQRHVAEHILSMGFNPDEEVDYAYIGGLPNHILGSYKLLCLRECLIILRTMVRFLNTDLHYIRIERTNGGKVNT